MDFSPHFAFSCAYSTTVNNKKKAFLCKKSKKTLGFTERFLFYTN